MMKKAIQGAAGACLLFLTGTLPVHATEHKSLLYPQYHFENMNRTVWVETTTSFSDHPSISLGDSVLVQETRKSHKLENPIWAQPRGVSGKNLVCQRISSQ